MATTIMTYELVLLQFDPENRNRLVPVDTTLNALQKYSENTSNIVPKNWNITRASKFKRFNSLDKVYRPSATNKTNFKWVHEEDGTVINPFEARSRLG